MGRQFKTDVNDGMLRQQPAFGIGEIGDHQPIELVADTHLIQDEIALEAFMNEPVTIIVHQTPLEGALLVECPCVNGRNQPIVRGEKTVVRRAYVEALAQATSVKFSQIVSPYNPADITMVPTPMLSMPFSVVEDRNPMGREWLEGILAAN